MSAVAVTEALGEWLSPQPGHHVSQLPCQVVLPVLDRPDRASDGCAGTWQSVPPGHVSRVGWG
jgi:hypothetical protein